MAGIIAINTLRDLFYLYILPTNVVIGQKKHDYKFYLRLVLDMVWVTVTFILIGYAMAHIGLWHCDTQEGSFWKTFLAITAEYWAFGLLNDNTSMRYVHPWMHKKENFWIHRRYGRAYAVLGACVIY